MDFLKDIVKEIGDDFTQLASDIEDTERYVDTGSYILTDSFQVLYLVAYLGTRLLLLLVNLALEKLSSLSQLLKIFLTLILMGIAYILIQKPQLINPYWNLVA